MSVKDLGSNFTESPKCSDASSRNSVAPTPTAGTLEYEPIAGNLSVIETFKREFFSAKRLYQLDGILRNLDWAVAFQIEALLRNALLHTDELFEQFLPRINQQCRKKGSAYTGRFLQEFQRILRIKDGRESPLACFERILWSFVDNPISFILAKCSQRRWRSDCIYRMQYHTRCVIRDIRNFLWPLEKDSNISAESCQAALQRAWYAWDFSVRHEKDFGAKTFGLIALGIIFDCLELLKKGSI